MSRAKCDALFRNCLALHDANVPAHVYLRELMQTKRCDQFSSLEENRDRHQDFIARVDRGSFDRLMSYAASDTDKEIALQVCKFTPFGASWCGVILFVR
jgi:hypothetical protein